MLKTIRIPIFRKIGAGVNFFRDTVLVGCAIYENDVFIIMFNRYGFALKDLIKFRYTVTHVSIASRSINLALSKDTHLTGDVPIIGHKELFKLIPKNSHSKELFKRAVIATIRAQ